ncbi:MAG: YCF48-related protein [Halioglobus sp.]|nr:YCF48-related protein [Halioglobus sp.]
MSKEAQQGWTTRLPVAAIGLLLAAPVPAAEPDPVWMFNFNDVFLDIACMDGGKAVVVGDRGTVLVTHGSYPNLWSPRDSRTTEMLTAVSFVDATHGWAAGHGGIILHTDDGGQGWRVQRESSPENLPLFDIHFVSREVGYASGAYDTLLKSIDGGETWRSIATGTDVIYNGVFFHDADNGFLLGEFGSLLRTADGGESWRQVDIGDYQGSLFGISFLSRDRALAYGISGKLMLSEDGGDTWEDIASGTEEALFRAAADGDDVVVVGKSGIILTSSDGGRSFSSTLQPDNYTLAGVCARADDGFLAVGEFGSILDVEVSGHE